MDAAFQAKFFLYEQEVPFSSKGSQIILHAEQGDIILEAVGMQAREVADAEEDESINASTGTYEVDREVEKLGNKANSGLKGLAAKALGTAPQKAKSSVKKRNNVASKALRVYDDTTKNLERQVSQAQSQMRNIRS
jgi:hypothetical protein